MTKLLIQRFHPFSIQSVCFVRFLCLNSEMFKTFDCTSKPLLNKAAWTADSLQISISDDNTCEL